MDTAVRDPLLTLLAERVKALRARRGLPRKALAKAAGVSERHLANLEYGVGNPSVLVLQQVAQALQCSLAELLGDVSTSSPEWLLLRELLAPGGVSRDEASLKQARLAAAGALSPGGGGQVNARLGEVPVRSHRVALIGLRGAGKSTLGRGLAAALGLPFVELSNDIEALAGGTVAEIQGLYGVNGYRRYERRALEQVIERESRVVIATPGGLVSDVASFNLLLAQCTTVWLQADPEDHMRRVIDQGDLRPMSPLAMGERPAPASAAAQAISHEAMEDLRSILRGREAFYSKADLQLNTSRQDLPSTQALLNAMVMEALGHL